jgi:TolB-like protein/predicted Zn-dependent protease
MSNKISQFWQELKRRKVTRVITVYAATAFIIMEASEIMLPRLGLPDWTVTFLIILLIAGFPIAIILSWIFDVTPEGIKKTKSIEESSGQGPTPSPAKRGLKVSDIIIIILIAAVCLLLYPKIFNRDISDYGVRPDEKSNELIAVLPFSNTKLDPETDYLGFAIADQIIGNLVYLNNITVRPSGSIRKYDKQVVDPVVAASDLKVDYLLFGNYLKEANIIRLNIELVDVTTNEMIWREPIEVDFNSAFELQDIVAQRVVEGLNVQFSQKELNRIGKDTPQDPLAYEYYLRSISYPFTNEGDQLAIDMLNKAIELDSNYAPAYAQLGNRIHRRAQFGLRNQKDIREAENLYLKSLSLNEDYIYALFKLSGLYTENGNTWDALQLTEQMLEINPNNAEIHFSLGYIFRYAGMNKEAIQEMEKAIAIDPGNQEFRSIVATYTYAGDFEKSFEVSKDFEQTSYILAWQGNLLLRMGKMNQAVDCLSRAIELDPDGLSGLWATVLRAHIEGDRETGLEANHKIEEVNIMDAEPWYHGAANYALMGDQDGCIRALRRAVVGGFFNYPFMQNDMFFDSMRDNAEFKKIMQLAKEKHLSFERRFFNGNSRYDKY